MNASQFPAYTERRPENYPSLLAAFGQGRAVPAERQFVSSGRGRSGRILALLQAPEAAAGRRVGSRREGGTARETRVMDTNTPKTIFITGATGLVGGHATEEALLRGHRVRALVRAT